MPEKFERCALLTILSDRTLGMRSVSALLGCKLRRRDYRQRFSFRAISVAWLLRALGKSYLGRTGRRAVCRSTHEGQLKERNSTLENLARQKQPGLNMGTAGRAIQCVIIRCNERMVIRLGNQFALITLRLNCRWIGQPVKRSSNDQQAQQACRDLDFQSLANRPNVPSGKYSAGVHPRSHTLSEFTLCSIGTDSMGISLFL